MKPRTKKDYEEFAEASLEKLATPGLILEELIAYANDPWRLKALADSKSFRDALTHVTEKEILGRT